MNNLTCLAAARVLVIAWLASLAAWGTQPASLIVHNSKKAWVLGIANVTPNPGKVKVFKAEPKYDEDGELTDEVAPVATLRNTGDTYTLPSTLMGTKNNYWLVFYPKWTLLNLTVTLAPDKTPVAQAATLNVKQSIIKGLGSVKVEVKVSETEASKVMPNVDNFENTDGGALLTLN